MDKSGETSPITAAFLQNVLGNEQKLISFDVKPGSNVGDGYLSAIYAIDATIEQKDKQIKNIHLLTKCFPAHPVRQQMLKDCNVFWKELDVYQTLIPALSEIAPVTCAKGTFGNVLPFPPCIGGEAVDFEKMFDEGDLSYQDKVYNQFDIYLMLMDMRKEYGFRMADRRKMLDLEHVKLAVKALSKFHAFSWAYKKLCNVEPLKKKFRCIDLKFDDKTEKMWEDVFLNGIKNCAKALEKKLGPDSNLVVGTQKLVNSVDDILEILFSVKGEHSSTDLRKYHRVQESQSKMDLVPWKVALHGDCWTNNMLFRYNEEHGNKPIDVVLIDLQFLFENCPTFDIANLVFTSTTTEFRQKHLNEILKLYHDEFVKYCNEFGIDTLPGFTFEELKNRFNSCKVFGYVMGSITLPIMLRDGKNIKNPEEMEEKDIGEYWTNLISSNEGDDAEYSVFEESLLKLAQEMFDEGVI